MKIINAKRNVGLAIALAVAAFVSLGAGSALAGEKGYGPDLPWGCSAIEVPAGNSLAFHAYAAGVQVYRWNGSQWAFVAPDAGLFADPSYRRYVGSHFAGPTWMSRGGTSSVIAATAERCSPDAEAVAWLLLEATETEGYGIFGGTTFIQRANTSGGLAPTIPGGSIGQQARVPYTAEYYFYRADD
ncbi:MAG: DUF3455 domain-containing protein [Pyrinomonadaceae bacterium]